VPSDVVNIVFVPLKHEQSPAVYTIALPATLPEIDPEPTGAVSLDLSTIGGWLCEE
jgi:hypothetical protein